MNADAFYNAAHQGNLAQVKEYLNEGGHVDDYAGCRWTALCAAANNGQLEVAKFLIEKGAAPHLVSGGRTALAWAQYQGHNSLVETLKRAEMEYPARITPEWSMFGSTSLAHISFSSHLNRKLTEIFNFESRQLLTTYENTQTGEEKLLPIVSFDDLDEKMLKKNLDILNSLGGKADPDTVFRRTTFKKNALPSAAKE